MSEQILSEKALSRPTAESNEKESQTIKNEDILEKVFHWSQIPDDVLWRQYRNLRQ